MVRRKNGLMAGRIPACAAAVVALCFFSCNDAIYVSFTFVGEKNNLYMEKNGIEVNLRLSAVIPVEHELHIRNKRDRQIWMDYRNISVSVDQAAIVVPAARNYDSFIRKINRQATLNCNKSENPYSCVDAITGRGEKYIGKGFSYGAIAPGKEKSGRIVFDFPRPGINNILTKRFKGELRRGHEFLGAHIQVQVKNGAAVETFTFPVSLRIYDRLEEVPLELQAFW